MAFFLVTGGAGFIGSNLVSGLILAGHKVRVLDNLSTGKKENLAGLEKDLEFIEGDVRDPKSVRKAVNCVDYVLHQAALPSVPRSIKDPVSSNDHNVNGTLTLLLAAKEAGVKRLVFAASSSAYGDNCPLPQREDFKARPLSPYAITKYAGELYCQVFNNIYGLETISLRYFNVYGPKQNPASQYAAVIPKFITQLQAQEAPTVYGDGEQSRDFTFVDNVVAANIKAAFAPAAACGKVFNIACGERTTLNELLTKLKFIMYSDLDPVYLPHRAGDVKHSQADISEAQKYLGYEVNVRLEAGLHKTIAWFTR